MNDVAIGPPSRSTSAVGARAPVSPNRLTSTRNVRASRITRPTSTPDRLSCSSSMRAAARAACSPSATAVPVLIRDRLEDLDQVRRADAHALRQPGVERGARDVVRRLPVRDVDRDADLRDVDAADAGQPLNLLAHAGHAAGQAVDLDEPARPG